MNKKAIHVRLKDETYLDKTIRKKPFQLILFFLLYIEFFLLQSGTGYQ